MSPPAPLSRVLAATLLAALVVVGSCVDAPYAPEDGFVPGPLVFAPSLSWVGPDGAAAATAAQGDALGEAFDLIDRYNVAVHRAVDQALVLETTIEVEAGDETHDLRVSVTTTSPNEQFLVTLTALQGDVELFTAPPVVVVAVPEGSTTGTPPAPVNVTLTYSGPGVEATAVEVEPGTVVLGPNGSATLTATVLDEGGNVLGGVPLSWTAGSDAVATVAGGEVSGQADGVTTVVVATPTGLQATAQIYVVGGSLAYTVDGALRVRAASGGEVEEQAAVGASAAAWSPDGERLYYSADGQVRMAGADEPLVAGGWPAISPNGAYLAVAREGLVVFANADGSLEREGPEGTHPAWLDDATLVVGGGSIEEVDVSGSRRATVVDGDAAFPAVGPGGALAYVEGGGLLVSGGNGPLAAGVLARPSWSASGHWIAFSAAGGIMVVPADGSAEAVPLPGLEGAADPAWQPATPLTALPSPSLTGFDPDPPVPGRAVDILGSGFDVVIPANNRAFWPTPDGTKESGITAVAPGRLSTVMPRRLTAGQLRVENLGGSAVLPFEPTFGTLEISASTPSGNAVAGVEVVLLGPSELEAGRGRTDAEGSLLLGGLIPGTYFLVVIPPDGFSLLAAPPQQVELGTEVVTLAVSVAPRAHRIEVEPEALTVAVGESLDVVIRAYDVHDNSIEAFHTIVWHALTHHVTVDGSEFAGTIDGVAPVAETGEARFQVTLGDDQFPVHATVTSHITGHLTREGQDGTEPLAEHDVALWKGEEQLATAATAADGSYRFDGLLAGVYTLTPAPAAGVFSPASAEVTLGQETPTGQADFVLSAAQAGDGEVIVLADVNFFDNVRFDRANNRELTRNFVTNGSRTRTVLYQGHSAYNPDVISPEVYLAPTYDYITITLGQTVNLVTTGTTGSLSIPDDVASIWLIMPQALFDADDVAEIRRYVAAGGRVVVIAENYNFPLTNQTVQNLMNALGSAGTVVGACFSGVTSDVTSDPLMADVHSVETACTSFFTAGEGDLPLIRQNDAPIMMRLRLGPAVPSTTPSQVAPGPSAPPWPSGQPGADDPTVRGSRARGPGG